MILVPKWTIASLMHMFAVFASLAFVAMIRGNLYAQKSVSYLLLVHEQCFLTLASLVFGIQPCHRQMGSNIALGILRFTAHDRLHDSKAKDSKE